MRLSEVRDLIVKEVSLPASCDDVVDSIGDVCIETPHGSEENIGSVLERCGEREFESVDELYDSVVGSLGEAHVGRKKYDDRGPSLGEGEEVSF
ncbi:MAG: hypothetical protein ACOCT0_02085 [Halobacteriota archaeon]